MVKGINYQFLIMQFFPPSLSRHPFQVNILLSRREGKKRLAVLYILVLGFRD
jgi:hypothetical protein